MCARMFSGLLQTTPTPVMVLLWGSLERVFIYDLTQSLLTTLIDRLEESIRILILMMLSLSPKEERTSSQGKVF